MLRELLPLSRILFLQFCYKEEGQIWEQQREREEN